MSNNYLFDPHRETVTGIAVDCDNPAEDIILTVSFKDPKMEDITIVNTTRSNPYGMESSLNVLGWSAIPAEVPSPYDLFDLANAQSLLQKQVMDEMVAESGGATVNQVQYRRRVDLQLMLLQSNTILHKREKMRAAAIELSKITTPFDVMVSYVITAHSSYNKFSFVSGRRYR